MSHGVLQEQCAPSFRIRPDSLCIPVALETSVIFNTF